MNQIELSCEICKKQVMAEVLKKEKPLEHLSSKTDSTIIQYGIVQVLPHRSKKFGNLCKFSNTQLRTIISLNRK